VVKVDLKGKPLRPLLQGALFSPCLYSVGETAGISHTTASESGVFLACIPIASLVASTEQRALVL
jgi:drug/metabolite transporter (DMT)-like permease